MGKVRRLRQKYHATLKNESTQNQDVPAKENHPHLPITVPSDNLFAGINIDVAALKTQLSDDTRSVKSQKSTVKTRPLPKKDKLKLRRERFMKKIDVLGRIKKEQKAEKKRRKTPIIGDVNPLRDALPSLESLLKNRTNVKYTPEEPKKSRGIAKAKKRKKELVQGVKTFKALINNDTFKKNPLETITRHVQAVVAQAKLKT